MKRYKLRMTGLHYQKLQSHLFPGDGKEAVALLLCGRRDGDESHVLTVRDVALIPHETCVIRTPDQVTWPTDVAEPLMQQAYGKRQAIVKIHSHTVDYALFSRTDNESDQAFLQSVCNVLDDGLAHASVIMLPDGTCFGRVVDDEGISGEISLITVVDDDLRMWSPRAVALPEAFTTRHAQAFGQGTTALLRSLSAAVVGCSGTGSIVAEQLARLGIGRLVLVDPDFVEEKNLNRIINSGKEDAYLSRPKVHVLASAIARMGLGQEVRPIHQNLASRQAVCAVAECDVVFGCMDGAEGRHLLNRLATFYCLPYFDVGIRLEADGKGGVSTVAGAVHYIQPGRSSLFSRGVYDLEQIRAEEMRRTNPELYERHREEGYIHGVEEDRPAVISVNMFFASLALNDFLARIHPYRNQPNADFAMIAGNLSEVVLLSEPETKECDLLKRYVGRGDTDPLLDRPSLS